MISKESFSASWIQKQRKEYPKADPRLIERQIYAFELVGLLAQTGKKFVLKGGTSLLLLLPKAHRLSIDVDVVGDFELKDLQPVVKGSFFYRVGEDERRKKKIPKRHFKFFYTSAIDDRESYVLLDVLDADHGYPQLLSLSVKNDMFHVEDNVTVQVPTINGIFGDKLTAFAPNTIGVPYGQQKSMEIVKQLFDIGELFNESTELGEIMGSYKAIQKQESIYHEGHPSLEKIIEDTIGTSLSFCQSRLKGGIVNSKVEELHQGIKQIQSYLMGSPYRIDEARISASKAAFIATAILLNQRNMHLKDVRFDRSKIVELKDVQLGGRFEILNKLKSTQTEAFYYWWQIEQFEL